MLLTSTKFSQTPPHLLTALVVPNPITFFSPSVPLVLLFSWHTPFGSGAHAASSPSGTQVLYGITSLRAFPSRFKSSFYLYPSLPLFVHSSLNYLFPYSLSFLRTLSCSVFWKRWTYCIYFFHAVVKISDSFSESKNYSNSLQMYILPVLGVCKDSCRITAVTGCCSSCSFIF